MKDGEYDRALKILNKSILIDVNNTLTLKYIDEINKIKQEKAKAKGKTRPLKKQPKVIVQNNDREELSGNDVIIPKNAYKDVNYGLLTFINIVVGIVIGAALVFFIVTPAKNSDVDKDYKDKINSYQDKVAMLNISVSELERQIQNLTNEKTQLQNALQEANNQKVDTKIYDIIIEASNKYVAKDLVGCADVLSTVDTTKLTSESMMATYNALKTETYAKAGEHYNNVAYKAFNSGDYTTAVPAFEKAVIYAPDNVGLWYNMGKCYKAQNGGVNNEKSVACFEKVIELAPDSEYAGWAKGQKR
jgi:tetratricopeptide (TPR) repeat protein